MSTWPKPSSRFAEYVRKVKSCGHWEHVGTKSDKAILRHHSGAIIAYLLHDGGNDKNGARNFAADAQSACGCRFIENRNRKPLRKHFKPSGYTPDLSHSEKLACSNAEEFTREWHAVDAELAAIEVAPSRRNASRALDLIKRRSRIEESLTALHRPIPIRGD